MLPKCYKMGHVTWQPSPGPQLRQDDAESTQVNTPGKRHNQGQSPKTIEILTLNPLRAKFFRGNINIYLHFVSFIHTDATQVVKTLPQIRQEPTYST